MTERSLIGTQLGHYEIAERLGAGGMGEVYLATDTRLNREVALKILPPDLADSPERRERFEREARTVAALSHPNIVTIYSVEHSEELHFLTMERVRGRTLDRFIDDDGMPLAGFFDLAVPLAEAVRSAHARGISHRDLKPSNVMVDDEGHLKVLDFGLAKMSQSVQGADSISRMATSDLTREGRIVGTVSYMSPEQAEGKPLDPRTDIFSLGILFYEMLAGARPFGGDTNIAVLSSILKDTPTPLSELRRDIPVSLSRIVQRALQKDPEQRYPDAVQLRDDLVALRRDLDTGDLVRSLSGPGTAHAPPSSGVGRGLRFAALAFAGSLVVVMLSLWALRDPGAGEAIPGGPEPGPPAASPIAQDDRQGIAVLHFDNLSGDPDLDWLRAGLADMLITDLSESPEFRVLGTDRLYQILEDLGHPEGPEASIEVVRAVADAARSDRVVTGSFLRAGETMRISARLEEVSTGNVLFSETVEQDGDDAFFDLVDLLSERLRARLLGGSPALVADAGAGSGSPPGSGVAVGSGGNDDAAAASTETAATGERSGLEAAAPVAVPPDPEPGPVTAAESPSAPDLKRSIRQFTTDSVEAFRTYTEALEVADRAGPEAAVPLFEEALLADPDFALAMARLAEAHASMGDETTANEYAQRALDKSERLPQRDRMFMEGRVHVRGPGATDLETEEAVRSYQKLIERYPDHAGARDELAVILLEGDRVDEAVQQIEQLKRIGVDPTRTERLGRALLGPGITASGREQIEELVRRQPDNAALQCTLAEIAAAQGKREMATAALAAATAIDPEGIGPLRTGWRVHAMLGEIGLARRAAEELSEQPSGDARFEGNRALAVLAQFDGDVDSALDWYDQAAAAASARSSRAWQAEVEALRLLLSAPDSERADQRIVRLASIYRAPHHRALLVGAQALVAALQGRGSDADRLLREMEQLERRGPIAAGGRGRMAAQVRAAVALTRGDARAALQTLEGWGSRSDTGPGLLDSRLLAAQALILLGNQPEARRALISLEQDAGAKLGAPVPFVRSLYYLGTLAWDNGDADRARAYFRRFVDSWGNGSLDRDRVQEARSFLR
jgi:serine/threonine protein kinase/TolB-like protein/tetratricopeptide (TPR) repeat protein